MVARFAKKPVAKKKVKKQVLKKAPIRSKGAQVLAPGAGATTRRAFGSNGSKHMSGQGGSALACWDAKLPAHLPLPRAVGPYLTIRTTKRFSTSDPLVVFGTFEHYGVPGAPNSLSPNWDSLCAFSVPLAQMGNTPATAGNTINGYCMDLAGFGNSAQAVPSAMTVQVMNPNSLQETCGMIYGSVMTTQIKPRYATQTFNQMADGMVQFMNPRLMAAPKLALRGVQASSYPLNMAEVADFKDLTYHTDGLKHIDAFDGVGWAPIVFYNPDCGAHAGPALEYLVTTEWRVRFDTSNPAAAGHVTHRLASDSTWAATIDKAAKLGAGMIDIADVVANSGLARAAARFLV